MRHRTASAGSALWPAAVLDSGGSLKLLDPLQGAVDKQSLSRLSDAIAVLLESEAVAALTDIADLNRVHVLDVLLGRSQPL
ncbi:MAG TPA: hypothetical protein VNT27_04875 [Propionibacteriaceae bacterium]|nr:hypothetical protein [Propionibacteriaceae bacterium]